MSLKFVFVVVFVVVVIVSWPSKACQCLSQGFGPGYIDFGIVKFKGSYSRGGELIGCVTDLFIH